MIDPLVTPRLQSFACLFAVAPETALITHATANASDVLGHAATDMIGAHARDLLGSELWHGLRNAASNPSFAERGVPMAGLDDRYDGLEVRAFGSGPLHVVEIAKMQPSEFGATPVLEVAQMAMTQLVPLATESEVCAQLASQIRHFSGFDRVSLWRITPHGQAIVAEEAKRRSAPSSIGQTLPWSDIWQDGLPLSLLADAHATLVPLLSSSTAGAPPDVTRALSSPPSPGLTTYLEGAGHRASVQLRLTCAGAPWGVVDCQSPYPRHPSHQFRALAETLRPFLDVKLQSLARA